MRILLVAVVLGCSSLCTAARVALWAGPERNLWQEATDRSPLKVRPWVNLGNALAAGGDAEGAELFYQHALELSVNPARGRDEQVAGRAMAEVNFGIVAMREGHWSDARRHIGRAHVLLPKSALITDALIWANTISF